MTKLANKEISTKPTNNKTSSANRIKILVSTSETQDRRTNDFCFVPENEPVKFGVICDRDSGSPDSECGCSGSLDGFYCYKGTTTFKVTAIGMTKERYIDEYIKTDSFYREFGDVDGLAEELKEDANFILELANEFTEGSVFDYRAGEFVLRKQAS
jgi:hypothetical protein